MRINPDLSRDSRVRSERKVSLRIAMVSDFVLLAYPSSSSSFSSSPIAYSFSISGKEEKRRYVCRYVRMRSEKNNKCYGSCVAEPAPAINHVSRVLKSTSKFSFKSHAVRFIKEHY